MNLGIMQPLSGVREYPGCVFVLIASPKRGRDYVALLIAPHFFAYPKKARVMSPNCLLLFWGTREGRDYVAISVAPHSGDPDMAGVV